MTQQENRRLNSEATILAISIDGDNALIAQIAQQAKSPVPVTLTERIKVCRIWLAR